MAVAVDLDNRRLAEGLARALALGGQTPSLTAAAGRSSSTLRVETLSSSTPEHALGLALAWLLVNKPPAAHCTLRLCGEADAGAQPIVLHASPVAAAAKAAATAGVDASLARNRDGGDVAAGAAGARPSECVEVYHMHAHFNDARGSEAAALALLGAARTALCRAGEVPLHEHVWHSKNGPHDPWSWELWVESERALGVAAAALARWRRPAAADAEALGLYVCLHADTDQEWTAGLH